MSRSLFRKKSIDKIVKDAQEGMDEGHHGKLNRVLTVRDLTFMGIAAVVGAGVFSTIGAAAYNGGPGISLLFVITAVTCGFSALCYAEFASRVPIAGSAYTYAYVSFGEIIAWIIGWALILEYAIGNIVVAISWSQYFNNLLVDIGIHLPAWATTDHFTAASAYDKVQVALANGEVLNNDLQFARDAWNNAPLIGGSRIFVNIPAFIIVVFITWLTYVGIRESKKSTNAMVVFKVAVILFVIILGAFSVKPGNWSPFMPNGIEGVLKGVSAVFYAYIGFDAISTTAEECKNPQRDLPRGMIYSLLICTVLYILITLVLTGMVNYTQLNVNDPLAEVFERVGQEWTATIVSISAVIATTSVLLVFQLGQPRIWMSMSRDGLLPKAFSRIHPKFRTPSFATIVTGVLVAIPTLFLQSSLMMDLTSIGTLFAFILVSGGVLFLPRLDSSTRRGFQLPYINGRYIVPALYILFFYIMYERITENVQSLGSDNLQQLLFLLFIVLGAVVSILTFLRRYSLIPVMGVLFCSYLLIEIPAKSWLWFFVWMLIGLSIYFLYGYRKSKLAQSR
jgi:amino acid transporter